MKIWHIKSCKILLNWSKGEFTVLKCVYSRSSPNNNIRLYVNKVGNKKNKTQETEGNNKKVIYEVENIKQ